MIKVEEGQKVQLEENRFATITSEGTLIIEYITEGPLGQDRARCIGLSSVGAQALLDLLANGEAVEHSVHPTLLCTCFKNNLGTIERPAQNCPTHNPQSG